MLLANAARYLASLGKRVVAIDFDLEAPGLHYKMHIARSGDRIGEVPPERGVVDYLLASARGGNIAPKLADYMTQIDLPLGTKGQLYLMPAGAAPSGSYWKRLTRLLHSQFFSDRHGAAIAACIELKARIEEELKADCVLIDSRTGITELAGLATALLADKVICLVINNKESLVGTRAVMRSFSRAPRLRSQNPIELFTVLSRIPEASPDSRGQILNFLNEPGPSPGETLNIKHLYVLHTDPDLATEERLHVDGQAVSRSLLYRDYLELFNAMVGADAELVVAAARRHEAIMRMKRWLVDGHEDRRYRRTVPDPFDKEQIDEGVALGRYKKRYADIVAYGANSRTEALLAAEYVDDVKSSDAWRWWEQNTDLRCVVLFGATKNSPLERRVFTRGKRGAKFIERSDYDSWIVKWPASFAALDDPGDRSVEALIKAVQRGEDSFITLLVTEWQHSSFSTLHGGAPFRPHLARAILDGLAGVKDKEMEVMVLWRTAPDRFEREFEKFGPEGGSLEEQMERELHAPLFWRLSVEAKIDFLESHGRRPRGGACLAGLQFLCRDLMGLTFDEDRDARTEVQRIVGPKYTTGDAEFPFYQLTSLFRDRVLKFEMSADPSPEMVRRTALDYLLSNPDDRRSESVWHHANEVASKELSQDHPRTKLLLAPDQRFHAANFLGSYDPGTCRITIYTALVDWIARVLSVDRRALANVVFLREAVRAFCHIGRDLDGRMWEDFGQPPENAINYRPSLMHETLVQYFCWRMLERLNDFLLIEAFNRLADRQPDEYQVWRQLKGMPVEEVRKILLRARAGLDALSWIGRSRQ